MLHFIAEQTFLRIMVGLQYYVNCVWSICVCVCPRYTYKKHLADGIYYVIALEPGSRSGIIGDERSNSGATNPWFPSYIHIYIRRDIWPARSYDYTATCIMFENSHSCRSRIQSLFFPYFDFYFLAVVVVSRH